MSEIRTAALSTVASLFEARARVEPDRIAIGDGSAAALTYGRLAERVEQLAGVLLAHGVGAGDRVAVLSENRSEILELLLAAARIGAIVACQSWRLAAPELRHCIALVEPKLAFVSPKHRALYAQASEVPALEFDQPYERELVAARRAPLASIDP